MVIVHLTINTKGDCRSPLLAILLLSQVKLPMCQAISISTYLPDSVIVVPSGASVDLPFETELTPKAHW
jgi:hypothetical protein